MDLIAQLIVGICIAISGIVILITAIKIDEWKIDQSRCKECGQIPLSPAPCVESHASRSDHVRNMRI